MATDSVTVSPTYNGDSVSLTAGMIVRLAGQNNNVVRAQADTAPHAQGVNGVVISGASAPTTGCVVVCTGKETVQMESGLTLVVGQTVYVSPNIAGKGTNVVPAVVLPVGTIADVSNYASQGTVEVDFALTSAAGTFPGYGTPGSIGPNEPTAGVSSLVLRADSLPGQKIEAQWPIANVRWYAIDGTNGNDANAGFSDVSSADAGTKAVKTFAALSKIFPRVGANRKVVVMIAAGTYTGQGGLDVFLNGCIGYQNSYPLVVATGTNITAGAVAFAGNLADRTYLGMVTGTGLFAAGYNPTGSLSATSIQCQQVGGGGPAFAAEPAKPDGLRIRWDSATATVALQGKCYAVAQTSGGNTVVPLTAMAAVPTTADVFYLEQPGCIVDTTILNIPNAATNVIGAQIAGVKFSTLQVNGGQYIFAACEATTFTQIGQAFPNLNPLYVSEIGTATCGMGLLIDGTFSVSCSQFNRNASPILTVFVAGEMVLENVDDFFWTHGNSVFGACVLSICNGAAEGQSSQPLGFLGGRSHIGETQCRLRGVTTVNEIAASLIVHSSRFTIDLLDIEGVGAVPAIGVGGKSTISVSSGLVGSTGNTDVGLDLTHARGSTILIYSLPTLTGTAGDIRLSDGTIISWTTAMAGVVDPAGNILQGSATAPLGTKVASAATAVALGNVAPASVTSATPTAWTPLVINGVKYLVPLWPST